MSPSEALTVKMGDILTAVFQTSQYKKGEEFMVLFLHREKSGMMHDTGADFISLRTGKEVMSNIQDFIFADLTKSWRTSEVWKKYIEYDELPKVDALLEYIFDMKAYEEKAINMFQRDIYRNELVAAEVLIDILNGYKNKYGIEICTEAQ